MIRFAPADEEGNAGMAVNLARLAEDARATAMDVLAYRLSGRADFAESRLKRRRASVQRTLAAHSADARAHCMAAWQDALARTMRSKLAIEQAAARAGVPMPRQAAQKGRRAVLGDDWVVSWQGRKPCRDIGVCRAGASLRWLAQGLDLKSGHSDKTQRNPR